MDTYSISLRLRRVTYEDAYVAVPVTEAIMKKSEGGVLEKGEDGHFRIDPEVLWAEGIRISQDNRVEWKIECTKIEGHPIQQTPPEGRKKLNIFYDA